MKRDTIKFMNRTELIKKVADESILRNFSANYKNNAEKNETNDHERDKSDTLQHQELENIEVK